MEDGKGVNGKVAVGGKGVELGVSVGISVSLAVGVRVPKLRWMITLGVTAGTYGTHNKFPGVMNAFWRQFARWSSYTLTPNDPAMRYSVSPGLTM